MPQIKQYTTQESANTQFRHMPTAQESDFGGPGMQNFGNALINAGADVGAAGRADEVHAAQFDATTAYVIEAEQTAQATKELEAAAKQPTADVAAFADTYTQKFSDRLDALDNTFVSRAGQQNWKQTKARLVQKFGMDAGRVQAHLFGVKANEDVAAILDANQITVNTQPDMFEPMLDQTNQAVDNLVGVLPDHRAEIKRQVRVQLANAAMEGIIRQNPELGKVLLEEPKKGGSNPAQYVTGEQFDALRSKAEAGIERIRTLKDRQRLADERARHDQVENTVTALTKRILDPKNNGGVPSDQEIAASGLTGEKMAEIDAFKMRRTKELAYLEEDRKNPAEVHRLLNQMIADGDDPTKTYNLDAVRQAYREGKLSTTEFTFLSDRFAKLKDDATNTFEKDLNAMMGSATHVITNAIQFVGQPDAAMEAVGRIRADAYAAAERLRKENKNPRLILDPNSKDYFFTRANLATYTMPPSQALKLGAAKVLENEKRTEQFIEEGNTLSAEETKAKYIPGYVPKPEPSKIEPSKPQSNTPKTALDAFASLKGESKAKALNLYQELKKAHVKDPGPASTALVEHLHQAYVNMGIGAAQARLFANESVAEIKKTLDAKQ